MMERRRSARVLPVAESPRGLVRRRLGADGDPWNLALVQRAEVWDQVRMRHLLDSLLAGYPIGAILLCRVEEPSRVIHTQGEKRVVQDADPDGWQLLDGQQRINALVSMFTTSGRYGRFYLHMTRRRTRTGVAARRREKERFLRHIAWTETPDDLVDDRDFCIDLSRWASWAEDELNPGATFDRYTVTAALRNLDSMFTADLDPQGADAAAARLNDLVRAWHHPSVPVLRAEVGSPLDVLEIFSRINLGGVQVAGIDVYFAAVKTFWTEAEQRLAHVTQKAPFLRGRSDALRFVARLASRGIGHGEALPLDVGRLTGPAGELQRAAMQELTASDAVVLRRVETFSEWMQQQSALGHVLHLVTPELWDDVLAWVATCDRTDDEWYAENQPLIDAYLLGATLFRYRQILRERFQRAAFREALAAGAAGQRFPVERIVAVTRAGDGLRMGRRSVPTLAADRQRIADENGTILTCLAQGIEYQSEDEIDWDHIFPAAQARRMWSPGAGRRRHHGNRWLVNAAGNLWALHASTNRSLQDTPPAPKFAMLRDWDGDPAQRGRVWERSRWSLTEQEVEDFIRVDELLDDDPANIDEGMALFADLVRGRTRRLLDTALERFPQAKLFAPDTDVLASDPSAVAGFAEVLGLSDLTGAQQSRTESAGELTSSWDERQPTLRRIVRQVVKALSVGRASSTREYPGYEFAGFVPYEVDGEHRWARIGVSELFTDISPFVLQFDTASDRFDDSIERLKRSPIAGKVHYRTTPPDGRNVHAWIPLPVHSALPDQQLVDDLKRQALEVFEAVARTSTRPT